jgi:hypothetical protein
MPKITVAATRTEHREYIAVDGRNVGHINTVIHASPTPRVAYDWAVASITEVEEAIDYAGPDNGSSDNRDGAVTDLVDATQAYWEQG